MRILYVQVSPDGTKKKNIVQVKDMKAAKQVFYDMLAKDKKAVFIEKIENPTSEDQKNKIESKLIVYEEK